MGECGEISLDIARLRLGDAKFRIDKFIDQNIVQWAEEELLQRAQKIGWSHGLSENAIGAMFVEKVGFKAVDLVWDYRGPHDEPIHLFIEEDTDAHTIEAKGKFFGGADYLMWRDKMGKPIFRKKVKHPGTKGKHIIRQAKNEGIPELKNRVNRETQKWIELTKLRGSL